MKNGIRIMTVAAAVTLGVFMPCSANALAAEKEVIVYAVGYGYDSNGEFEYFTITPAVVLDNGSGNLVITGPDIIADECLGYAVASSEDAAELGEPNEIEGWGLVSFACEGMDSYALSVADSVSADEKLTVYYTNKDWEVASVGCHMNSSGSGCTLEGGIGDDAYYPWLALNEAGEAVFVVNDEGGMYYLSNLKGTGDDSDSDSGDDSDSDSGDDSDSDSGDDSDSDSGDDSDAGGSSGTSIGRIYTDDEDELPEWVKDAISGACIGFAVAAAVAIVRKVRKKNAPAPQSEPSTEVPSGTNGPQRNSIDPEPHIVKPVQPTLYLICQGGEMDGRCYPITKEKMVLGRLPDCHIHYSEDAKGISRHHCEVFWHNGRLNIMDLASTSGTYIRGKGQIPANVPTPIGEGDTFYLGQKANAFTVMRK